MLNHIITSLFALFSCLKMQYTGLPEKPWWWATEAYTTRWPSPLLSLLPVPKPKKSIENLPVYHESVDLNMTLSRKHTWFYHPKPLFRHVSVEMKKNTCLSMLKLLNNISHVVWCYVVLRPIVIPWEIAKRPDSAISKVPSSGASAICLEIFRWRKATWQE